MADGRVYAAAVEGGVRAFDLQTGAQVWHYDSDLPLSGGPGAGDGLVVVGSLEGDVIALDAATGAEKWKAKVGNEVIAAPGHRPGHGVRALQRRPRHRVRRRTGERRWFWNHDLPSLTVRGNDCTGARSGLRVRRQRRRHASPRSPLADGRPLWEQVVAQPEGRTELDRMADIDGTPVLDGAVLVRDQLQEADHGASTRRQRPSGLGARQSAARAASASLPTVWWSSDPGGTVWALDKASGSAYVAAGRARTPQPDGARRCRATTPWSATTTATCTGCASTTASSPRANAPGGEALRASPVVVDGILVVQNIEGEISAWRIGQ